MTSATTEQSDVPKRIQDHHYSSPPSKKEKNAQLLSSLPGHVAYGDGGITHSGVACADTGESRQKGHATVCKHNCLRSVRKVLTPRPV